MRIGSGWTRTKRDDAGKTFIAIALDDSFKELCPQLKNCSLILSYISPEDRRSEKAPGWALNLMKDDEDKKSQNKDVASAEKEIQQEASKPTGGSEIGDEEIPF